MFTKCESQNVGQCGVQEVERLENMPEHQEYQNSVIMMSKMSCGKEVSLQCVAEFLPKTHLSK